MHAAISCLFPRHRRQTDLEGLNCEVNLAKEKGQTYNRREHGGNKEATDNQASRIVQHGAREQHCDDEAHQKCRRRAELNGVVDQPPTFFQDAQLVHDCGCVRWFGRVQSLLQHAGTIDDASKAPAQHVQQSADARQKEYGAIES